MVEVWLSRRKYSVSSSRKKGGMLKSEQSLSTALTPCDSPCWSVPASWNPPAVTSLIPSAFEWHNSHLLWNILSVLFLSLEDFSNLLSSMKPRSKAKKCLSNLECNPPYVHLFLSCGSVPAVFLSPSFISGIKTLGSLTRLPPWIWLFSSCPVFGTIHGV